MAGAVHWFHQYNDREFRADANSAVRFQGVILTLSVKRVQNCSYLMNRVILFPGELGE